MRDEERLAPECEHRLHDICHGTYVVYVPPWTVPVVTGRCDCPCHPTGAGVAGAAPDGTGAMVTGAVPDDRERPAAPHSR
ncbi:hypothetical protein [Streptomyces uncialis]|uniref:hypothetical protein n=1 Tax=Streptomyces uncialis TaxID=1048205 RepID=UPI0033E2CF0E